MLSIKNALAASVVSAFALLSAPETQAATVTLDFPSKANPVPAPFTLTAGSPGIQSGNCETNGSKPCLAVNKNGPAVLSIAQGLTFSVLKFWFELQGKKDTLFLETDNGTRSLLASVYGHNNGGQDYIADNGDSFFQNITYLTFSTGPGTARIDDLKVDIPDVAPVPLPASALLLLGGVGGLAALRRRKKLA